MLRWCCSNRWLDLHSMIWTGGRSGAFFGKKTNMTCRLVFFFPAMGGVFQGGQHAALRATYL